MITQQERLAQAQLRQQEAERRADIERQSTQARESVRRQQNQLELDRQRLAEDIRKQQARLSRLRTLPGIDRASLLNQIKEAENEIQNIEAQAKQIGKQLKQAGTEIGKAEREAQAELSQKVLDTKREITRQANQLRKKYVELDNGELVDRTEYNKLTSDQQRVLKARGTDGLKKYVETQAELAQKEFDKNNIKLSTGEYVSVDYFNQLSPSDKSLLKSSGIQKYNETKRKQAKNEFHSKNIAISPGVWIDREFFNSLTGEQQTELARVGIDKFIENQEAKAAEFKQNNVQLNTGEWVSKDFYNSLPSAQKTELKIMGVEAFNQYYQSKAAEFSANNVELNTGEYVDKKFFEQLTPSQQVELKTLGVEKFNKLQQQYAELADKPTEEIVEKLVDINIPQAVIKAEIANIKAQQKGTTAPIQPTLPDKYKVDDGYNLAQYIRDNGYNPDKVNALINEYNFTNNAVKEALTFANQDWYKIGATEQLLNDLKAKGVDISKLNKPQIEMVAEFIGNGKIDINKQVSAGMAVSAINLKYAKDVEELLKGVNTSNLKDTAKQVLQSGTKPADLSVNEFVANYLSARDIPDNEITQYKAIAELEYERLYGTKQYIESKLVSAGELIAPVFKALQPGKTKKDISGTDIAVTVAQLGLIAISPGIVGIAGKATGTAAKLLAGTGKAIQAASVLTFPAITTYEAIQGKYNNKPGQLALNIAIDVALVGAIYGKPLFKAIKSVGTKVKDFAATSKAYETLGKAVKSGNVAKIQTAALELDTAALKIKDPIRRLTIRNQAGWTYNNAAELSKQATLSNDAFNALRTTQNQISKAVKSGAAGGTIDDLAKKNPDAFKKISTDKALNDLKQTASKWVADSKQSQEYLRTKALDPTKNMEFIKPELSPQAEQKINQILKKLPEKPIDTQGIKAYTEDVVKQITKEEIAKQAETWIEVKKRLIADWAAKKVGIKSKDLEGLITSGLTPAEMAGYWAKKELVTKAATQAALDNAFKLKSGQLAELLRMNLITAAFAYMPAKALEAYKNATSTVQQNALQSVSTQLSQKIKQAVSTNRTQFVNDAALQEITKANQAVNDVAPTADQVMPTIQYYQAVANQELTSEGIKPVTNTVINEATKVGTRPAISTSVSPATAPVVSTKPEISAAPIEAVDTGRATPAVGLSGGLPDRTKTLTPLRITLPNGKEKTLTKKELEGAIAWKQGFIYILIFPPYGENDIAYSKKPFPGVRTVDGPQSAFITATRIGGKVPEMLARKLGFFDLRITTPKTGKPKLKYTRKIGKTKIEGEKTVAAIKGAK